jgi:hypothetical protein
MSRFRPRTLGIALVGAALASTALSLDAGAASKTAPTVAYRGAPAAPGPTQAGTKAIAYKGTPLKFALTKTTRGMGEPTVGVTKTGKVYVTTIEFDQAGGSLGSTEIHRSTDGGRSFKPFAMGAGGQAKNPTTSGSTLTSAARSTSSCSVAARSSPSSTTTARRAAAASPRSPA